MCAMLTAMEPWQCRLLILLGIFAIPCDASAETICPDMPRASYVVLDDAIRLSIFTIVPLKSTEKTIGYQDKWRKLAAYYFNSNSYYNGYGCFGNECVTTDERKYKFKGNGPSIIPNRSGGTTEVGSRLWEANDLVVDCKSETAWRFKIYEIYERIPGEPQLPYIIVNKEFKAIKVKKYGSAPSF